MASATAARARSTVIGHLNLQVELPRDATEEERNALIVRALVQEVEKRGGAPVRPGLIGPIQLYLPAGSSTAPPSPKFCSTVKQFLARMRDLKTWAGLSFADLERCARERGFRPLPHTTIQRLLSEDNDSRMPSRDQLTSLALVCGLTVDQWREWAIAWEEVQPTLVFSARPWVLPGGNGRADRVVSLKRRKLVSLAS